MTENASWLTENRRIVGLATDLATMQGVSQERSADEDTPLVCESVLFNDGTEGWLEFPAQLAFGPDLAFAWAPHTVEDPDVEELLRSFAQSCAGKVGCGPETAPKPTLRYFVKRALNPGALARDIARVGQTRFHLGVDGRLYRTVGRRLLPDGEDYVAHYARTFIEQAYAAGFAPSPSRTNHVREVLNHIRDVKGFPRLSESPPEDLVFVRQGAISWRTGEPAFDKESVSPVQLPVTYRPDADCPLFRAFIKEVLPWEGSETFIFEVMGYAFLSTAPLHVAFILVGGGRNGKSVFLRVLRALIGDDNVSAVSLHDLDEQRFATSSLYGKLANIHGDISARQLRSSSNFKQLTGEDRIEAEFKGKDRFAFTNYATMFYSANSPPGTADVSQAWYERVIIIPFEQYFPPHQADRDLPRKLTAANELSGILNHALAGARRVVERGHFQLPDAVDAANQGYRRDTDVQGTFIREALVIDEAASVDKKELYAAFSKWCRDEAIQPVPRNLFYDAVRQLIGVSETTRRFNGVRVATFADERPRDPIDTLLAP